MRISRIFVFLFCVCVSSGLLKRNGYCPKTVIETVRNETVDPITNKTTTHLTTRTHHLEECCAGYENSTKYPRVCIPKCSKCTNGDCTHPERCKCYPGYSNSKTAAECEPICNTPCEEGFCIAPNKCGFKNNTSSLDKCARGYELINNKCEPIICNEKNFGQNCVCEKGYELVGKECQPVCSSGCANGKCVKPEECFCYTGYELKSNQCTPICSSPCLSGKCSQPYSCDCFYGYKLDTIKNICVPICEKGCDNGTCVSYNVCSCDEGFELKEDGRCESMCKIPCINGVCTKEGTCSCRKGYYMNQSDPYDCIPCVDGACEITVFQRINSYGQVSSSEAQTDWVLPTIIFVILALMVCFIVGIIAYFRRQKVIIINEHLNNEMPLKPTNYAQETGLSNNIYFEIDKPDHTYCELNFKDKNEMMYIHMDKNEKPLVGNIYEEMRYDQKKKTSNLYKNLNKGIYSNDDT